MRKQYYFRLITVPLAMMWLVWLILAMQIGCSGGTVKPTSADEYSVEMVLIQDINTDSALAIARWERNGSALAGQTVTFGGLSLIFNDAALFPVDSVYSLRLDSLTQFAASGQTLTLVDGSRFSGSFVMAVTDTFSITDNFSPQNRLLNGLGQVSFEWTGSANADAYVMAAVKADEAYTEQGFSLWLVSTVSAGTIPPEAFALPFGDNDPDTGLYNVYAYVISGEPDSALSSRFLPVPLPSSLSDNVDRPKITGNTGTITVTLLDTVRVAIASR